jgi:hypothetical protein
VRLSKAAAAPRRGPHTRTTAHDASSAVDDIVGDTVSAHAALLLHQAAGGSRQQEPNDDVLSNIIGPPDLVLAHPHLALWFPHRRRNTGAPLAPWSVALRSAADTTLELS